jgi:hypothetical protein
MFIRLLGNKRSKHWIVVCCELTLYVRKETTLLLPYIKYLLSEEKVVEHLFLRDLASLSSIPWSSCWNPSDWPQNRF